MKEVLPMAATTSAYIRIPSFVINSFWDLSIGKHSMVRVAKCLNRIVARQFRPKYFGQNSSRIVESIADAEDYASKMAQSSSFT